MKETSVQSGRRVTIRESCRVAAGKATIADAKSAGAIRITGKNIEVDCRGFTLSSGKTDQSTYAGIGILVEHAENVVLRNATVSGYKHNIVVRKSKRVLVTDCDASGSFMKPLLGIHEYDQRDWLDIFDERAWREYGSGVSIEACSDCRVQRCESHGAVNGLWLIRSTGTFVVHNDFSHNTGWGIWMWESSHNTILYNNCDWCVRCEDPERFSAGGDSAGIMLSNNNCHNLIAHNTMRYGGDGFFLSGPAGAPTCNDNVIAFNDGSHSPHNAFESTGAARNQFIGNIASNSRHGFWIGGSTHNQIVGNIIENIVEWGVSVDTGFGNVFSGNEIRRALRGIVLLRSSKAGRESRDNRVIGNTFEECRNGVTLGNSRRALITGNTFKKCATAVEIINGSRSHAISLNNFIGCKTLIELDGAKDVLFQDNFCGATTRDAVLRRVKTYKDEMLAELRIDNVRTSRVRFEAQPVQAASADKAERKDRAFHWYADTDKLVGHAETHLRRMKEARG
ncbi:MAG: right-handed parallel beta-helix repeat-containing protein [Verrucomicrobia bacterium]|nr:right-handed parallel beta-helix repeat-containing protein [Verrucomicrobiota bacterium]